MRSMRRTEGIKLRDGQSQLDASISLAPDGGDIEWLRSATSSSIIIKGILHHEDAVLAARLLTDKFVISLSLCGYLSAANVPKNIITMPDRPRSCRQSSVLSSFCFLDFGHRELPFNALDIKLDLVARLHRFQHGGVLSAKHHRHAIVHVELFQWTMLDRDFLRRLVDFGDLTINQF